MSVNVTNVIIGYIIHRLGKNADKLPTLYLDTFINEAHEEFKGEVNDSYWEIIIEATIENLLNINTLKVEELLNLYEKVIKETWRDYEAMIPGSNYKINVDKELLTKILRNQIKTRMV